MLLVKKMDFLAIAYIVRGLWMIKLIYLSLIIGLVDFLVEIVILRAISIELVEILIGLKIIRVAASLAGILIGVIVIKSVVVD